MEYNRYQQMAQQVINNLTQNGNTGMPKNNGSINMGGYPPANAPVNAVPYRYDNSANPAYGMPNPNMYQNPQAQPNPYGQQNVYAQQQTNPYAQQNQYNQPPVQQPVSQNWVCPSCQANNDGGRFCAFCGTPRNG